MGESVALAGFGWHTPLLGGGERELLERLAALVAGPEGPHRMADIAAIAGASGLSGDKYAALRRLSEGSAEDFGGPPPGDAGESVERGMGWAAALIAAAAFGPGNPVTPEQSERVQRLAGLVFLSRVREGLSAEEDMALARAAADLGHFATAACAYLRVAAASGGGTAYAGTAYASAAACMALAGDFSQAEALRLAARAVVAGDPELCERPFVERLLGTAPSAAAGRFLLAKPGLAFPSDGIGQHAALLAARSVAAAGALGTAAEAVSCAVAGEVRARQLALPDLSFAIGMGRLFPEIIPDRSEIARALADRALYVAEGGGHGGWAGNRHPVAVASALLAFAAAGADGPDNPGKDDFLASVSLLLSLCEDAAGPDGNPISAAKVLAVLAPEAAADPDWTEPYRDALAVYLGEEVPGDGTELAAIALEALDASLSPWDPFPSELAWYWLVAGLKCEDPSDYFSRCRGCLDLVPDFASRRLPEGERRAYAFADPARPLDGLDGAAAAAAARDAFVSAMGTVPPAEGEAFLSVLRDSLARGS